ETAQWKRLQPRVPGLPLWERLQPRALHRDWTLPPRNPPSTTTALANAVLGRGFSRELCIRTKAPPTGKARRHPAQASPSASPPASGSSLSLGKPAITRRKPISPGKVDAIRQPDGIPVRIRADPAGDSGANGIRHDVAGRPDPLRLPAQGRVVESRLPDQADMRVLQADRPRHPALRLSHHFGKAGPGPELHDAMP